MVVPADWIEHRRAGDRELLGWLRLDEADEVGDGGGEGGGVTAFDRLGRSASGSLPWHEAETVLDDLGIGWLSGLWELPGPDGQPQRVRIAEVDAERVVVVTDTLGAADVPVTRTELPFPPPPTLRPYSGDAHTLDDAPRV
jgi:hypothetical protein